MSTCNIDHSHKDVQEKYNSQEAFLPTTFAPYFTHFFASEHEQSELNEVFHLLKKYDLASAEERAIRNKQLAALLNIDHINIPE